ncbi:acyl carrier protein [Streptomyces tsukubensis]|uniref:Acyl carrier protein n=1 Tax=Streptomyces tsukubensis TaxID=83656 RepID=A0A1V4AGU8_9ACTN|nr:acyl carrier protein [Streptomyces tsukubensis]OON82917.1 acyl carrier protein [Streptomyces tsukubensis]QFR91898.1 acyl carrier protein [Streptomyces tsukubensis]
MTDAVFDTVRDCAVEVLQVAPDEVTEDAVFTEHLGATSLTLVELIMAIEEASGVDLPDTGVESVRTVRDACELVRGRL